jgi:uncharacterized protein YbbC (DUF1343 family)
MLKTLPLTGIDFLLKNENLLYQLSKKKIGLLTNQAALTQDYQSSANVLKEKLGDALQCILTPEHGWSGFIGEGVKIEDGFDPHLGLPLFSLYGNNQKFLYTSIIDTLIIDLQDVGLRCYTYTATCAKMLDAFSGSLLEVIICDRPNPLGPDRKGPLLDPDYRSFLAYLDDPFQHGQTIGELLSTYNTIRGKLPLTVIPCQHNHDPYHYPWIPPSPNLPSWDAVLLYPALVLLEGTNISEGRGTSLPFTCLGAPRLNFTALVDFINTMSGIRARPLLFTPQSGELIGKECQGAHLLITDPNQLDSFSLGLNILSFLKENYSDFEWAKSKKEKYFIDALLGTDSLRKDLEDKILAESSLAVE